MAPMKNELEKTTGFLLRSRNMDISMYDDSFLEKMLKNRLSVTGSNSFDGYFDTLKSDKREADTFFDSLHITFSEFFRNPITFAYLEQIILPLLIEQKKKAQEKEIRIWSAACAAGEEAYSLAILFAELIESAQINIACRIFATDICQEKLMSAQKGIYQSKSLNKVTLKQIQTYFIQQGETYTIAPRLRETIGFSMFDLLSAQGTCPPASIYGNFDIIICSNMLFYYKPEIRKQILEKIGGCLAIGGYLITGETERDIVKKDYYYEVFLNSAIFQKK